MQSLQNWLGGGAPDREPAPGSGGSVLSQWQQYSGGSAAAPPSAGQGDRLLASAEEGTAGAGGAATSGGGTLLHLQGMPWAVRSSRLCLNRTCA